MGIAILLGICLLLLFILNILIIRSNRKNQTAEDQEQEDAIRKWNEKNHY